MHYTRCNIGLELGSWNHTGVKEIFLHAFASSPSTANSPTCTDLHLSPFSKPSSSLGVRPTGEHLACSTSSEHCSAQPILLQKMPFLKRPTQKLFLGKCLDIFSSSSHQQILPRGKAFSNPLTTQMPVPVSLEHKLLEPLQNYPVALWKCQACSQSMTNLEAETEERQADVAEAREDDDDDERHNVRIVAKPQSPQRSHPLQQKTQSRTLLPRIVTKVRYRKHGNVIFFRTPSNSKQTCVRKLPQFCEYAVRKFGSLVNPNSLFRKQQQRQQFIGFVLLRRSGHQILLARLTNDSAAANFLQLVIKVLRMEGPGLVRIRVRVRVWV